MLADDVLDHLAADQDLNHFSDSHYLSWLADQIRQAPRYVLTQSALEVVVSVAQTRLSSVVTAYPLIRTPEPIWIEYAFQDERQAREALSARALEFSGVQRVGYLVVPDTIECKQISVFSCIMSRAPALANVFQIVYLRVNLERPWSELEIPNNELARSFRRDPEQIMKGCYWGPESGWKDADQKAADFLVRHSFAAALPGYDDFPWLVDGREVDCSELARMAHASIIPVATMVALLRTRNRVEMEKSDLTKLNKAREKSGKARLLDYSTVKVSLTKDRHVYSSTSGAGEEAGISPEARRASLVGAHVKVRETGIFLWHEHPRRGFGVPKPKTFVVVE